jgi:hypothetical protein
VRGWSASGCESDEGWRRGMGAKFPMDSYGKSSIRRSDLRCSFPVDMTMRMDARNSCEGTERIRVFLSGVVLEL